MLAALALGLTMLTGHKAQAESLPVWVASRTNGYCLTANSANAGTRVYETPCSDAHAWTFTGQGGYLFLQGHPTVLGDSGGYPELKNTPSTGVTWDSLETVNGTQYAELELGSVSGRIYLHANGNGQYVSIDNEKGDLANYWELSLRQ